MAALQPGSRGRSRSLSTSYGAICIVVSNSSLCLVSQGGHHLATSIPWTNSTETSPIFPDLECPEYEMPVAVQTYRRMRPSIVADHQQESSTVERVCMIS